MTDEHPNAALTRRVFAAFGKDPKVIAAALSRDVVWRVPGNTVMSGEYHGPRDVVEFLRRTGLETGGTYRSQLHTVVADVSGRPECTTPLGVREQLGDKLPLIVDGGPTARTVATTIVDLSGGPNSWMILREGAIPTHEIALTLQR